MQNIRYVICLSFVLLFSSRSDTAVARQRTPATRLAERFVWFCLDHRLSPDVATRLAEQLGVTEIQKESLDAEQRVWRWRDMKTPERFLYSFISTDQPVLTFSILSCSVTGHVRSVIDVKKALARSKTIGAAEQISKTPPSVPSAAWFFVTDKEPFWVFLVGDAFGSVNTVTLSLATHQRRWQR